jgi:DDE superfamily endonuclease
MGWELSTRFGSKGKSFVAEYRLDPSSFDVLSGMLEMHLQVDQKMSKISTKSGPISTKSRLGAALIILAGGRRVESMRTHGLSQAFVYDNLRKIVKAINNNPRLAIVCDTSASSMILKSKNYGVLGDHNLFKYCVGAIDGLAIKTRTPSRNVYQNTARFTSGSKKIVCINMQAVCLSDLQFQAVTCKHVGCTNDAVAFETSSLKGLCKSLPFPYHWLGDNAYTLNETMLVPYVSNVSNPKELCFKSS